jgi:hypothetical protein
MATISPIAASLSEVSSSLCGNDVIGFIPNDWGSWRSFFGFRHDDVSVRTCRFKLEVFRCWHRKGKRDMIGIAGVFWLVPSRSKVKVSDTCRTHLSPFTQHMRLYGRSKTHFHSFQINAHSVFLRRMMVASICIPLVDSGTARKTIEVNSGSWNVEQS